MSCKDCKYKGKHFPHLDGHDINFPHKEKKGNKWFDCTYPLPMYVSPMAIMEYWGDGCKAYIKKSDKK